MARRPPSRFQAALSYPNRQAHEAALDRTDAIGQQPGVLHADLVQPLRKLPDELAAWLVLRPSQSAEAAALWFNLDIPTSRVDGRAPWRAGVHLRTEAAYLPSGWVLIGPDPTECDGGTFARLLFVDEANRVTEHPLVAASTGRTRSFDGMDHAKKVLTPAVLAQGSPPPGCRWNGGAGLHTEWDAGAAGSSKATCRGRNGLWSVEWSHHGFAVACGRTPHSHLFDTLAAAMRFISTEDAR